MSVTTFSENGAVPDRPERRERAHPVSEVHEPSHVGDRYVPKLDSRGRQQLRELRDDQFDGARLDFQRSATDTVQSGW